MNRAAVMAPMDAAAGRGLLALQHCAACVRVQYPPGELCRTCLSPDLDWTLADQVAGHVLATCVSHHSFVGLRAPVRLGLVQLSMGPTALCFVPNAEAGSSVRVTAGLDSAGRAVMTAMPDP